MSTSNQFSQISSIEISNETSWQSKIFLTFDVDWATDEVIEDVLLFCEPFDVEITLYATHQSNILSQLSAIKKYEIGLHPNFNNLLKGQDSNVDFFKV